MLKDQIDSEVKKAEESIQKALQDLHESIGLIPVSVNFDSVDIRTMEEYGKHKRVLISNVEVIANT